MSPQKKELGIHGYILYRRFLEWFLPGGLFPAWGKGVAPFPHMAFGQ